MGEKEHEINGTGSAEEGNPKPSDERGKRRKNRRKNCLLKEIAKTEEEQEFNGESLPDKGNPKYNDEREKRKKQFLKEIAEAKEEQEINGESSQEEELSRAESGEKHMLVEAAKGEEEQGVNGMSPLEEENPQSSDRRAESRKKKRKERLLKEAAKANRRGVCYLSRIPPHMDHVKLRQILSQFGDIQRIYLAPEDPAARVHRKKAGGFRGQGFSEGWVEFTDKSVAKRVADMLNGEQIGGRKRSQFYYDLWNIKYLSKFKWDDLTEEIAYKNAIREQRLALEISAAKREGDFYRSKVDRSRALSFIEERMMKKQKVQQDSGTNSELPVSQQAVKVIRQFPQNKPVADKAEQSNPRKDFLAGILRGSS